MMTNIRVLTAAVVRVVHTSLDRAASNFYSLCKPTYRYELSSCC